MKEPTIRHMLRCRWNTLKARAAEGNIPLYWRSFDEFLEWARPRFVLGQCIDRIDRGQGFTPENCRFVARSDMTKRNLDLAATRFRQDIARRIRDARPGKLSKAGRPATAVRCVELDKAFPSIASAARATGLTNGALWRRLRAGAGRPGFIGSTCNERILNTPEARARMMQ